MNIASRMSRKYFFGCFLAPVVPRSHPQQLTTMVELLLKIFGVVFVDGLAEGSADKHCAAAGCGGPREDCG